MIRTVTKNIFDVHWDVLVHQCNCFHVMGAGIAKAIKEKYPEAYEADLATDKGSAKKLGTYSAAPIKDDRLIVNMYGQFRYGRDRMHTSYDAVNSALGALKTDLSDIKGTLTVAVPFGMGCMNAGGNWTIVSAILSAHFEDSDKIDLTICKW